jgi:protein O-GlcNAc transferase
LEFDLLLREREIEMISLQNGARPVVFGSARDDAVGGFQVKIEPPASVSAASSAALSFLPFKCRDSHHEG